MVLFSTVVYSDSRAVGHRVRSAPDRFHKYADQHSVFRRSCIFFYQS